MSEQREPLPDQGRVEWRVSEDRQTVEIRVTDAGGATSAVTLGAAKLEEVAAGLGNARSSLIPEVPKDAPLGQKFEAVFDPLYWTEPESFSEGSLLLLRHPGFGWQAFVFPQNEVEKLQSYLARNSATITAEKKREAN